MIDLRKVSLLLWVKLKLHWREAREDFLPLAVSPMVLGAIYLGFGDLGSKIYLRLQARISAELIASHLPYWIFVASVILVAVSLPNLIKELFAYEPDDGYLRALPIHPFERLLVTLVFRMLRNLVFGLGMAYLAWRIRTDFLGRPNDLLPPASAGLLFALIFSPLEILLVLILAKLRSLGWGRFPLLIMAGLAVSYAIHRQGEDRINPLLYPFYAVAESARLPGEATAWAYLRPTLLGILTILILSAAAALAFKAWSETLVPSVERAQQRERVLLRGFFNVVLNRFRDHRVAALLKRDLILTLRVFHRGIFLNFAAALFCTGLLVYLVVRFRIYTGPYLFVLSTGTCALGGFSLSLIAARLLKYQADFLWIDKSAHLDADSFWLSKVLFTNVLSLLFMPALTGLALAIFPNPPLRELARIVLVSSLITIMVASFTGSLAYEFERHPVLALFFCFMASVPLALFIVATYWWLVIFIFPFAMHHLKNRGLSRIRMILKHG
jgi:hypothetical protein